MTSKSLSEPYLSELQGASPIVRIADGDGYGDGRNGDGYGDGQAQGLLGTGTERPIRIELMSWQLLVEVQFFLMLRGTLLSVSPGGSHRRVSSG